MEISDVKKLSAKRRKLDERNTAENTLWQQCHSGFDDEIILSEQLGLNTRSSKGRKKDDIKLLEISRKDEVSSLVEKEVEIDWESSSSEDEPDPHQKDAHQKDPHRKDPQKRDPKKRDPHLRHKFQQKDLESQRTSREQLGVTPPSVSQGWEFSLTDQKETSVIEQAVLTDMVEESPESTPTAAVKEVDEADISDYESSEEPEPPKLDITQPQQDSVSPKVTSTQSPMISSFTLSTQESTDTSPIPSSQWVEKVRRGQQTTPSKQADKSRLQVEVEEGKDSAKKKTKFAKCGFAEKLQKVINREKSDIAFWHHQTDSESTSSGSSCSVRIETMTASRGSFVARCQTLTASDRERHEGDLPERLVVLFNRRTVEDHKLQVGSSLTIHPPWQTMLLPDTGETVLLCTYFCQISDSNGSQPSSSAALGVTPSQDVASTSRPIFRPNRLFSDEPASSKFCLNTSALPQKKSAEISTSLVGTVTAKGPSFDFDFNLRGLVMRACRVAAISPSDLDKPDKWRLLVQDRDGTFFEVNTKSAEDLTMWQGKLMDFTSLTISQRVTRTSNPNLFSMIDSLSQPVTLAEDSNSNTTSDQMTTSFPLQSISYIVNLDNAERVSECKDDTSLRMFDYRPLVYHKLSDILQSSSRLHHRVSFIATLIHITSKEAADPITSASRAESGNHLLFVTDSSLSMGPQSESKPNPRNYIKVEKLTSCLILVSDCRDLKELSGPRLQFEDVHIKEDGSFILDCYSRVRRNRDAEEREKSSKLSDKSQRNEGAVIQLPELTDVSPANTLVTLTGTMEGVDQDTAYSWPECNMCGSNQIEGDSSGGKLFCLMCKLEVTSPVTKIQLEVIVRSPAVPKGNRIKVLLKQETVTKLFGDPSSDEPFDLKRILGKPYQKTNCFVRKSAINTKEFKLEEI
ncbi:DNA repair-scaffolding protein-like isoform X1 [Apostichopus japonicus]|uniref:DNA repair-scaffolding protein-like isoform X1 n=1 Tax=Stichopus japonicus TaxID=307972 RepID=UPI003AB716DF